MLPDRSPVEYVVPVTGRDIRVLIPCAGEGERWGNHLGVPKHLAPLAGEPILHRTVRLVNELVPGAEVLVVVDDNRHQGYRVAGSVRRRARLGTMEGDIDKIASSLHLWDDRRRTVLLFGDVWWTRDGLSAALTHRGEWTAFGYFEPDNTGGELFGFSFPPGSLGTVRDALHTVGAARLVDQRGGWMLYRQLCGVDLTAQGNHGNWIVVDDWTEDMDFPSDWYAWSRRWADAAPEARPL